jgi:hypothetical protein
VARAATPDIDAILDAIRAEARTRGSKERVGMFSTDVASGLYLASHGMQQLEARHVADFLALPLDAFVATAYRSVLGREPDAAGSAHYQRLLLRGGLTRVEVLGRLSFSPEARRRGKPVPGILPAFVLAMLYRIPIAGWLLALAARALRLPAHLQDRSQLESTALASGAWMKR